MPNDFHAVIEGRRGGSGPGGRTGPRHAGRRTGQPRHVRTWRRVLVGRVVGMSLVGVLAFGGTACGAMYSSLMGKRDVQDIDQLVIGQDEQTPKDPSDPFKDMPVNILVMGTDLRDEANAALAGEADGMRSDTTMLVHISADRRWIEVVSIPRDSMVDLPGCTLPDQSTSRPRRTMFNEAFSIGGGNEQSLVHAAACTVTAVHALTGVTVTNHAVVKMNGVIGVVDAIGGVTMCFPEPVVENKKYGNLNLPAGPHTLTGQEAIGFLRVRHGTGMGLEQGSDLTRITRQQAFLNATLRQILSAQTLADPTKTYRLVDATLGSVSADEDLMDPGALAGLAWSLRGMQKSDVVMTELPVLPDPENPKARVIWNEREADVIWQRIIADTPPPGHEAPTAAVSPDPSGSGAATQPGTETQAPADTGTPAGTGAAADPGTASAPAVSPSPEVLLEGVCAG